jgi:hypothetical protein
MEPVCRILDDAELEQQGKFREWREDKQVLSAKRIFGSPGTGPKAFPKAFQNYKPSAMREFAPTKSFLKRGEEFTLADSVRQMLSVRTSHPDVSGCTIRPPTPDGPYFIPTSPALPPTSSEGGVLHGALLNETTSE